MPETASAALAELSEKDYGVAIEESPPDDTANELIDDEAPQKGASVASGDKEPENEEVEDVEGTEEEFDQMRTAAGWKKNETTGQWQKPNGHFAKVDELPPIEKGEPTPEAKPKRALATEFTVKDKEGKDVDPHAIADHTVTLKANGKTVTKTVDELARLAQRGFYNQEQSEKAEAALVSAQQTLQKVEGIEIERNEYRDALRRILSGDVDYLQSEMDAYAAATSPEALARNAQSEVRRLQEEQREQQLSQHAHSFATTRIVPVLASLQAKYPTVTEAEIQLRFQGLISPLMNRSGKIPPERFPDMERIAHNDLAQWVEHAHSTRADEQATTEAERQKQINRANGKTIIARRAIHKKLSSGATRGGTNDQAAPREKPKTAKEGMDRINSRLERAAF